MPLQQTQTTTEVVERWQDRDIVWTVRYWKMPCLEIDRFAFNFCIQEDDKLTFFRDLSAGRREKVILYSDRAEIWINEIEGDYEEDSWSIQRYVKLEPMGSNIK